jgi:cell division protein FtsI/penicillin-binding protein 2
VKPASKGFASNYRIVLLALGMMGCFAGLGVRLYWLHVLDREEWLGSIDKARRQVIEDPARRGSILDARGAVLATSRSSIVVSVDPSFLIETEKEKQKWPKLAGLLGMPEAELQRVFATKYRPARAEPSAAAPNGGRASALVFNFNPDKATAAGQAGTDDEVEQDPASGGTGTRRLQWVKLREDVSEQVYAEIKGLGIRGITADRVYRRAYPNNQLAAHLIGHVDRAGRPVSGIEFYTDFYLRGQNGWRVGERDGRRRELAQFSTREVPHADGYNVVLSIDAMVQDVIEQELVTIARKYQPLKASIIVSDPRTGFILGMANYPTFNLNEYNRVPKEESARMRNAAVADTYEPGSVFKIVAAAAAIEERLITRDTLFDCSLEIKDYTRRRGNESKTFTLRLPGEDHRFAHPLNVAEIIAHSSNKGAAQLGMLLGEERLNRYARAFGFGGRLGFPIGAEEPGLLRAVEKWDPIDITRIPMGHTVSTTVLQMHQAMAVIAGGGVLYRPQIIRQIRDASEEIVYRYEPVELRRVISEPTARAMATMLMGVASKAGTAPEAAIDGFDVAGKTGTTQKLIEVMRPNGQKRLEYTNKQHVASFVGFFPATARPGERQVAISVIVDEARVPNGGVAYGKLVAAPSFKAIGEKLIPILDLKPAGYPARLAFAATNEGGRR